MRMNTKHRKTLVAIFARPTSASIVFADIEALVIALGGSVSEREGSRVRIELNGEQWRCHRPHPGKEAKRYQVEEARELLERAGELNGRLPPCEHRRRVNHSTGQLRS
jgi:hypothetical protein